jgi:hypothetical protein
MRRWFLISCGMLCIVVPTLWIALYTVGLIRIYWLEGFYPGRYRLGILALSVIIGIVMVIAGLDIASSWKDSK